jgi:hypothetical protein
MRLLRAQAARSSSVVATEFLWVYRSGGRSSVAMAWTSSSGRRSKRDRTRDYGGVSDECKGGGGQQRTLDLISRSDLPAIEGVVVRDLTYGQKKRLSSVKLR